MSLCFLLFFLTFHSDFTNVKVEISVKARYHHTDDVFSANLYTDEKTPLT